MAYGLEVYNSSGNTVLSYTSRVPRFVQSGTFTVNTSVRANIAVSGMENNDSWNVFLQPLLSTWVNLKYSKNTGFFLVSTSSNTSVSYWVVRA